MLRDVETVVVGAGQAGLASAYFLRRAGLRPGTGFVVLDHGAGPGGAWRHRWPSLRLARVNGIHDLPGLSMPSGDAAVRASVAVPEYFARYEEQFDLRVRRPVSVRAVRDNGDGRLRVETDHGVWATRTLLNATGTWERPFWPAYPGATSFRGRQLHAAHYTCAEDFEGQHVVVVGGGITAVQLLDEISQVTSTTWVTRRPPVFRDTPFDTDAGRAAVAVVDARVRAGRPPGSVVSLTGLPPAPALLAARERGALDRRRMFSRLVADGVEWDDGTHLRADVVLWATGFRAALDHLAPLRLREPGGGIRLDGSRVVGDPRVQLVGYGPSASTIGAGRAARVAVREARQLLQAA